MRWGVHGGILNGPQKSLTIETKTYTKFFECCHQMLNIITGLKRHDWKLLVVLVHT